MKTLHCFVTIESDKLYENGVKIEHYTTLGTFKTLRSRVTEEILEKDPKAVIQFGNVWHTNNYGAH